MRKFWAYLLSLLFWTIPGFASGIKLWNPEEPKPKATVENTEAKTDNSTTEPAQEKTEAAETVDNPNAVPTTPAK